MYVCLPKAKKCILYFLHLHVTILKLDMKIKINNRYRNNKNDSALCIHLSYLGLEQKWQTQISFSQQSLLKYRVLYHVHLEPFKPVKLLWRAGYWCLLSLNARQINYLTWDKLWTVFLHIQGTNTEWQRNRHLQVFSFSFPLSC